MSDVAAVDGVYQAIEESAQLVNATGSGDKLRSILTAYQDVLAQAGIVFTVQTGERNAGELDYTISFASGCDDPYGVAVAHGFVVPTGHPVDNLLSDLRDRYPISEYMIDCGVAGGFKKVYAHFPLALRTVRELTDSPSMPPALAANADLLARHGFHEVAMIAIDYRRRTMNAYFTRLSPASLDPASIRSFLREIGLPEPDEALVEFAARSFRVNVTIGWDTPGIMRVCFAPAPGRGLLAAAPPAITDRLGPHIEKFVRNAPHSYGGASINLFGVKWTPEGECLDVASYYQASPLMRKMWMAFYKEEL